jgi:purine-binding chemotaxis protein CheW
MAGATEAPVHHRGGIAMQHRQGIELASAPVQQETVWDRDQHIIVTLAGATYAVPLPSIQEVEQVPAITPVPFSAPWIRGVINVRGTVLTLVDLPALLELGTWMMSRNARMLVIRGDEPVAVAVDGLQGMRRMPVSAMTSIEGAIEGRVADYLLGVYRGESELIGVLDLTRLLADADIEADRATQRAFRNRLTPIV